MSRIFGKILRWLKPGRRAITLLCINAGVLVLAAVFFGLFSWSKTAPVSQRAARVWANGKDERFAQVSVFIADDHALTVEGVYKLRDSVASGLKENSIVPPSDSARLYIDAYSGEEKLTVSGGGNQVEALATGIGGDFFFFHDTPLLYGQLISGDDFLKDVVVIDDALAWRLYGAMNVVGFEITIGNRLCYVGGVIPRGDTWPDSLSYGETSRVFVSFDMLESVAPGSAVTCYEITLPDPVSGFGRGITEKALGIDEQSVEIVENSSRYSIPKLLGGLFSPGKDAMQTKAIALPYWENAARAAEGYAALFIGITLVLMLFPAVCVVMLIVRAWRRRGRLISLINNYYRERQLQNWEKKRMNKEDNQTAKEEVHL